MIVNLHFLPKTDEVSDSQRWQIFNEIKRIFDKILKSLNHMTIKFITEVYSATSNFSFSSCIETLEKLYPHSQSVKSLKELSNLLFAPSETEVFKKIIIPFNRGINQLMRVKTKEMFERSRILINRLN
jgi:hypothetical protein